MTDQPHQLSIEPASPSDRPLIYAMRHDVYALELEQHRSRAEGMLRDELDDRNRYLVARIDGKLAGFVSLTPPGGRYSIDKYVQRESLPFDIDDRLWEIRILTVAAEYRGSSAAFLLMYAAYRVVASEGGRGVTAIGRREVMNLYERIGMTPAGDEFQSGAVTFQPMYTTVETLDARAGRYDPLLLALRPRISWRLPIPFFPPSVCDHGGAFFRGIGERFDRLSRRHDVIPADVLDAWFPPAPGVIAALQDVVEWMARTSPPSSAAGMLETIARVRGLPVASLQAGAGSSDLIYRFLPHWLTERSRVLILDPMYGEYAHILERVIGCRVDRFVLRREDGYLPDIEQLALQIARGYNLVVLVNPNSPTGVYLDSETIERMIVAAPESTRFWIDETYIELVPGGRSLEQFAAASRNTVVCKSMSKVYALSGLRVAYLCGPPGLMESARLISPPWGVGLAGQIAAVRALEDPRYYAARYLQTHVYRNEIAQCLRSLGLSVFAGTTNSVLLFPGAEHPDAAELIAYCRRHDLYLRDAGTMGRSFPAGTIRIAVRDPYSNTRMLTILENALTRLLR